VQEEISALDSLLQAQGIACYTGHGKTSNSAAIFIDVAKNNLTHQWRLVSFVVQLNFRSAIRQNAGFHSSKLLRQTLNILG
jgi:hypothetical protein